MLSKFSLLQIKQNLSKIFNIQDTLDKNFIKIRTKEQDYKNFTNFITIPTGIYMSTNVWNLVKVSDGNTRMTLMELFCKNS